MSLQGVGSLPWPAEALRKGALRFYITNDEEKPAEEIVFEANGRCNRENLIQRLKSGVRSFTAPVDNLLSNGAYMVMAAG